MVSRHAHREFSPVRLKPEPFFSGFLARRYFLSQQRSRIPASQAGGCTAAIFPARRCQHPSAQPRMDRINKKTLSCGHKRVAQRKKKPGGQA
jgi:hypothetical protein